MLRDLFIGLILLLVEWLIMDDQSVVPFAAGFF